MFTKRYLLIEGNTTRSPFIQELPYETLEEAFDALRREFLRLVEYVIGKNHMIDFDQNGDVKPYESNGIRYSLTSGEGDEPCFFVSNGKGAVYTGSLCEITVRLTADELERAYRERERKYRVMDAERQLYSFLGYEEDAEEGDEEYAENLIILQQFEDAHGFSLSEAVNDSSEHYLLDFLAERFLCSIDCNVPENELWRSVIQEALEAE